MIYPITIGTGIEGRLGEALTALTRRHPRPSLRRIWFGEALAGVHTGELPLMDDGTLIMMSKGGDTDDFSVTLQLSGEEQLAGRWTAPFDAGSLTYRLERDWRGGDRVLAASVLWHRSKETLCADTGDTGDLIEMLDPLQRQFLVMCAPRGVIVDDLVALGPVTSARWAQVLIGNSCADLETWSFQSWQFAEFSVHLEAAQYESPAQFERRAERAQSELQAALRAVGLSIAHDHSRTRRVMSEIAHGYRSER